MFITDFELPSNRKAEEGKNSTRTMRGNILMRSLNRAVK